LGGYREIARRGPTRPGKSRVMPIGDLPLASTLAAARLTTQCRMARFERDGALSGGTRHARGGRAVPARPPRRQSEQACRAPPIPQATPWPRSPSRPRAGGGSPRPGETASGFRTRRPVTSSANDRCRNSRVTGTDRTSPPRSSGTRHARPSGSLSGRPVSRSSLGELLNLPFRHGG
jgi:hypothetical protein